MPPKRPNEDVDLSETDRPQSAGTKMPRGGRGVEDFSSVVKNKLQSYTRTGQACDRCKVRKIRCDAAPEGCSHCATQNLACYVTDRVTGRTERRGYLQDLEREKNDMVSHMRSLEALLRENHIDVKPWQPNYGTNDLPPGVVLDVMGNPINEPSAKDHWTRSGSVWVRNYQQRPQTSSAMSNSAPHVFASRPLESHLGVLPDSAPLSAIKGTQLSVLGTTIDITAYDVPDMEEPTSDGQGPPLYNKSLSSVLRSLSNTHPPPEVELPTRHDAFQYSEWYFIMCSPFIPILHKPSYMKLLARIYDDPTFRPITSEYAIVHMVFATIYFQYGVRNREEADRQSSLNDLSNRHLHWCLTKFGAMAMESSLTAVQALAMMATHCRGFPKPGCATLIVHFALQKAIELNLHRATSPTSGITNLETENRRRAWGACMSIAVTLIGRLGRPMPISVDEFDTEPPIAILDEYLTEDGITDESKIGHCNFQVGLAGYRIAPLYIEMYSTLYSVRRDPRRYEETVLGLEQKYYALVESFPEELNLEKCSQQNQMHALYANAFCLEFLLCLRHPSVCTTDDPRFMAENTRICEDSARKLLKIAQTLMKLKCLDTTWYQMSVYCAAMFSTLVAHWERRRETTVAEVMALKDEMRSWLAIINEIGLLVGTASGDRLSATLSVTIDRTILWIERDMVRAGSAHGSDTSMSGAPAHHTPPKSLVKQEFGQPLQGGFDNRIRPAEAIVPSNAPIPRANTGGFYDPALTTQPTAYGQVAYSNQPTVNGTSAGAGAFNASENPNYLYAAAAAMAAANPAGTGVSHASTAAGIGAPATSNPLVAFATQATQQPVPGQSAPTSAAGWHPPTGAAPAGGNTWQNWTSAMADSQDRYSANALLNLGGASVGQQPRPDGGAGNVGNTATSHAGQWPLLLFNGQGATSGP